MTAQYQLTIAGGGRQVVSTPGVAVPLTTTGSVLCSMVQINCLSTDTGAVVVCNSTAYASTGALRVGVPIWAGTTSPGVSVYTTDLQNVYIDATVSTDGVSFTYYRTTTP